MFSRHSTDNQATAASNRCGKHLDKLGKRGVVCVSFYFIIKGSSHQLCYSQVLILCFHMYIKPYPVPSFPFPIPVTT